MELHHTPKHVKVVQLVFIQLLTVDGVGRLIFGLFASSYAGMAVLHGFDLPSFGLAQGRSPFAGRAKLLGYCQRLLKALWPSQAKRRFYHSQGC